MDSSLFVSTFALIFGAELVDKTAFAILILAAELRPGAVFLGAAAGFLAQSAIAVAFGGLLSRLPARPVHAAAGLLFLVFAVMIWRRPEPEAQEVEGIQSSGRFAADVLKSFWVVFLAEWGDLTQLATATLAARDAHPLTIFAGATLGLWAVSALAVFVGRRTRDFFKARVLNRVAAAAFAAVGIAMLWEPLGVMAEKVLGGR